MNENQIFRTLYFVIRTILQYLLPALIILVFSLGTIAHFLRKYFQKTKMGSELMITLRLILIFIILIATNTTFHLYVMKSVIKFIFKKEDPCLNFTNDWLKFYMFMFSFAFHPIIYFWFSRVFWKKFYVHIVQRWRDPGMATVREEVIHI